MNVTVQGATAPGFVTVYPCGTRPLVSSVNFTAGQTVPNLVYVGLGFQDQVGFYNSAGYTHLVVDAFGLFTDVDYVRGASVSALAANGLTLLEPG